MERIIYRKRDSATNDVSFVGLGGAGEDLHLMVSHWGDGG